MSQAADLLARGQAFTVTQFPAVIAFGGQAFTCSTSGLRREQSLEAALGGARIGSTISFWLLMRHLLDAGAAMPIAGIEVECRTPGFLAGRYLVDSVSTDPTTSTLILRCVAPAQ